MRNREAVRDRVGAQGFVVIYVLRVHHFMSHGGSKRLIIPPERTT